MYLICKLLIRSTSYVDAGYMIYMSYVDAGYMIYMSYVDAGYTYDI